MPFVSDIDSYLWCSVVFTVSLGQGLRWELQRLGLGAMRLGLGLKGLVHIPGKY